jgi:UDP-4-amino-4,6-dideoxy-N-acetyl-beta-L-altrosamine transaminase
MKHIPYGHQQIDSNDIKEVLRVLRSDWITQGPKIREFEDALCKYTGAKYAVAVSSGTAALHIASLAAGIKKGGEVITSPITFAASANCVLYCGGKPIFADIQEDTANIDPEEIEKRITKSTRAIITIHFAGHPADLEEIRNIAKKHNLIVIEDAAHALGAEYKFKPKGSKSSIWAKIGSCRHSDMAIFSFHPVKSITTGEGGAVLTNNKALYDKLLILRNHGIIKNDSRFTNHDSRSMGPWYYEQQFLGFNYRITDFQCTLGSNQLKKLGIFIKRRREIVQIYNKALSKMDQIELPVEKEYVKSAWHLYPIKLRDRIAAKRRRIFNILRMNGIGVQVHYIPVYWHPYYRKLGYKRGLCRNAERFYQSEISIPLYPAMEESDITYVTKTLREVFKKYD